MATDQQRLRIRELICDIPAGRVASYGQIAELAGIPRGARQVGYTLRNLPAGETVPWHRVLRSSGQIAFDRAGPQFRKQSQRLADEGVVVRRGRVDMAKYRWQPDLDELLWKPTAAWDAE